ncbi:hypothetical protein J4229_03460 [Candidatus Pacearchaeota archaeon]|nr:hypothetical protein [Candidatus Pacearchaeota archaeon]
MGAKEFDYYMFIDYSENFLGYMILEKARKKEFLPKISKYSNFEKLVRIIDGNNTKVVKENELKNGSIEYKTSLVLDSLLNIERLKHENY